MGINTDTDGHNYMVPTEKFFDKQDYRASIKKHYSLLSTDELRAIVNSYIAQSPYARICKMNPAEKIEHKVAVKILKERKGLEGKVK